MEQGRGPHRGLPESSDLSAEARLGYLMERNGSLSRRSRRSSDVFEVADESTVVGCFGCWHFRWESPAVGAQMEIFVDEVWRSPSGIYLMQKLIRRSS